MTVFPMSLSINDERHSRDIIRVPSFQVRELEHSARNT
jgi:hypothetical protein